MKSSSNRGGKDDPALSSSRLVFKGYPDAVVRDKPTLLAVGSVDLKTEDTDSKLLSNRVVKTP